MASGEFLPIQSVVKNDNFFILRFIHHSCYFVPHDASADKFFGLPILSRFCRKPTLLLFYFSCSLIQAPADKLFGLPLSSRICRQPVFLLSGIIQYTIFIFLTFKRTPPSINSSDLLYYLVSSENMSSLKIIV